MRLLLAPLVSLALAASLSAQELVFQPEPARCWTRTHQMRSDLRFTDFEVTLDGKPLEEVIAPVEVRATRTLQVQDTVYEWVPGGKIAYERDYLQVTDAAQQQVAAGAAEAPEVRGEGFRQGQRVRFERSEPGQPWVQELVGDSTPLPKPLALRTDLDFECLLPPAGLKVGGSWNVDAQIFLAALQGEHGMTMHHSAPGGSDLPHWLGNAGDQPSLAQLLATPEKARVRCELKGKRRAGRTPMYEIHVTVSIQGETSLDEWARRQFENQSSREVGIGVAYASQNTLFTGTGVLLWNCETRTMHSLRFHGEAKFTRMQSIVLRETDSSIQYESSVDGVLDVDVRAEAAGTSVASR
ncbi:MAG: hypothetical protein R3F17_16335 [Planctomycetota bacterium]